MSKVENPPAFPENSYQQVGSVSEGKCQPGMSLRDYFAAHAPEPSASWLEVNVRNVSPGSADYHTAEKYAEARVTWRYVYADLMLKQRTKE